MNWNFLLIGGALVFAALLAVSRLGGAAHAQGAPSSAPQANVEAKIKQAIGVMTGNDQIDQVEASMTLSEIGAPAIPALLGLIGHKTPSVRYLVASALGDMGKPAAAVIPEIIGLLKDADGEVRAGAAEALGKIGARPDLSVGALEAVAQDPDRRVQGAVQTALLALGAPGAAKGLVAVLKTGGQMEKYKALEALGEMPAAGAANVDAIVAALNDKDPLVSKKAVDVLGLLGAAGAPGVPALIERLKTEDGTGKWSVVMALGKIGPPAKAAVPALIGLLGNPEAKIDPEAAAVIARAAQAIRATSKDSVNLAVWAASAIDRIEPGHKVARGVLLYGMRNKRLLYDERLEATERLAASTGESEAFDVLVSLGRDASEKARLHAGFALARFGRAEAVAPLVEALSYDNSVMQVSAATALGSLGPAAKSAVPALRAAQVKIGTSTFKAAADAAIAKIEAR
jgi:HEAT repeat protein